MDFVKMNDGKEIPMLGFGTYLIPDNGSTEKAVSIALEEGYRLIDTAQVYRNETGVGKAIKNSGLKREEIFIESKLWVSNFSYEKAKSGIESSLNKLGVDYIDLYILHQPYLDTVGAYKALEEAQKEGKIKSIGISNHSVKWLNKFLPNINIVPVVNQLECNPFCQQREVRKIMNDNNILMQSWYPVGHGNKELLEDKTITEIAKKYNKSTVQVILKWHIQSGFIVIPKATAREHIKDNINIFDFELTNDDMQAINNLDRNAPTWDTDDESKGELFKTFIVD